MPESRRPSYFPEQVVSVPANLEKEEQFWSLDPELVLTEKSANEMLRSYELMEGLLQSGVLERLGLNPNLSGFNSLKAHATKVAILSLLINDELRRQSSTVAANTRVFASAALFHDLGKLDPKIHDVIMTPGIIRKDEKDAWDTIRQHPRIGHDVVHAMEEFSRAERLRVAEAIYKHHERKDGKGYYHVPFPNIPLESQIITVADTMDAIMAKRPYKEAGTTDLVMNELERCSGKQFNPDMPTAVINIRPSSGDFYRHAA